MEPKKRETSKEVVILDRKFKIKKFDAMTGSYVAFKLVTKAVPMGMAALLQQEDKDFKLDTSKADMSRAEFKELQLDCLSVCSEIVDGREIQVLNDNNSFRAIGLEDDTKTVLSLTVHALLFNVKDFFGESVFQTIVGSLTK
jgi:hypothetical protein